MSTPHIKKTNVDVLLGHARSDREPVTMETVAERIKEEFAELFERYKGQPVTERVMKEFSSGMVDVLMRISMEIGEDNPMDYIRLVVTSPDDDPTVLFVNFEPKTERLRDARTVLHSTGEEGRAPIYCAFVDPQRTISGWGPTPIHAMADLERMHGDREKR